MLTREYFCYLKRCGQIFVALFLFTPIANAALHSSDVYLGFDSYRRNLELVNGFGRGMYDKSIPENNLYLGYRFNEYFAVESGQLFTQNYTRTTVSDAGTLRFGDVVPAGTIEIAENKIGMHGSHVNLLGRIPVNGTKVSLLGSVGVVSLKVKATYNIVVNEDGPLPPDVQSEAFRSFSSRRVIPRVMLGANYQVTELLGVRFLLNYEFTSQFKNIAVKTADVNASSNRLSFKNNLLLGIGLTVSL